MVVCFRFLYVCLCVNVFVCNGVFCGCLGSSANSPGGPQRAQGASKSPCFWAGGMQKSHYFEPCEGCDVRCDPFRVQCLNTCLCQSKFGSMLHGQKHYLKWRKHSGSLTSIYTTPAFCRPSCCCCSRNSPRQDRAGKFCHVVSARGNPTKWWSSFAFF